MSDRGQAPETAHPEPGTGEAPSSGQMDALRHDLQQARSDLAQASVDRATAVDQTKLLRAELQHRVRNMLALIRSIFSRTIDSGGNLEDLADHFRGRLDTLSRYQAAGPAEPGGTIDFEQIVREELHGFQFGDDPRITITGDEVRLGQDAAQIIALALHELVTNSLKFGVLAMHNDPGALNIGWTVTAATFRIEWRESGVRVLAVAPVHSGFGREFIEQALPYQMGATAAMTLRPGGMFCAIEIPVNNLNLITPAGTMDPISKLVR